MTIPLHLTDTQLDTTRQAFEAWAHDNNYSVARYPADIDPTLSYKDWKTVYCWKGWLAATALAEAAQALIADSYAGAVTDLAEVKQWRADVLARLQDDLNNIADDSSVADVDAALTLLIDTLTTQRDLAQAERDDANAELQNVRASNVRSQEN